MKRKDKIATDAILPTAPLMTPANTAVECFLINELVHIKEQQDI